MGDYIKKTRPKAKKIAQKAKTLRAAARKAEHAFDRGRIPCQTGIQGIYS
jgi:hypothetical protein